ncbi:DUF1439 domain-containing protein [Aeromonas simiae]|uniref:DUF1439 domain-containing protein n=1 Tax=Aeromonas simiae TaxID=218936 RepID=A0A5J6WTB5_9GAMM|nr:DUF1439 domain-containing protein [Aeromonas simiae]MDO2947425.1 DUF1439 domain-containing protein [Aeromonas simiae]MDO2951026.1 DUF1439 domain-containing protein [Aeromonas simiae]MDO2954619.1 DUF1439 domain-containing protein [Aeromonas simiae]QFI54132.1 DUF1439 domain-containing protein [Aeromonas simiae]
MILQSLLLTAALLSPGQSEITESQINALLARQEGIQRDVQMPGLFQGQLALTEGTVQIGRQQANTVRIESRGTARMAMGDKPPVDATLRVTFDGKPRYEPGSHAIYLDDAKLVDYRIEPQSVQQQYGLVVNLMLQSLQQRMKGKPVYRITGKGAEQTWWREHLTGVEVQPGKLKLLTR